MVTDEEYICNEDDQRSSMLYQKMLQIMGHYPSQKEVDTNEL